MVKMKRLSILAIFVVCLFASSDAGLRAQTPTPADGAAEKVAQACNAFGFELLARTARALPNQNVFLSPAGGALALAMVENGAEGATRRQMAKTLRWDGFTLSEINQANAALLDRLSNLDPKIQLRIADGIWAAKEAPIRPEFVSVNQNSYHAEVATADFGDPATVRQINQWASRQTGGKINDFLEPPLDPGLRLIVLNAIYFKGDWTVPFDKKLSRDLPFTLAGGQSVPRPRMSRFGAFDYYEDDELQAASLPYEGGKISMIVFLPRHGLGAMVQNLSAETWSRRLKSLSSRKGRVELPRFKLEKKYDFTHALAAMGMPLAFSREADFSGISSERLLISWVRQQSYVDVNEEGTEAAAVTGVGIAPAMAAPRREPPPFELMVDRPFIVALRENQTGLILFLGAIMDPGQPG
jgi:serine protease inhibitor